MRAALLLLLLTCLPSPAAAEEVLDLVYEAADGIDAARAEIEAGRPEEADALLDEAAERLKAAARIDPELPRIAFERARISLLRKRPEDARALLLPAMRQELEPAEHLRLTALLDEALIDSGRRPLGKQWATAATLRDAGGALVAGGAAVAGAGLGLALLTFADARQHGVAPANRHGNRAGWGVVAGGGALLAAGAGLVTAGGIWQAQLQAVLPGPWRLPERHGAPPAWIGLRLQGPLPAPLLARR